MPVLSAGLLLHREREGRLEVLIGHPGGPFWARKDEGAWSIPKGEYTVGEDPWQAARREFGEELGCPPPAGDPVALGAVRQPGGKMLTVFAVRGDLEVAGFRSNTFSIEWPPRSGRLQQFPEWDRVAWLPDGQARDKLLKGQRVFLDRLAESLS